MNHDTILLFPQRTTVTAKTKRSALQSAALAALLACGAHTAQAQDMGGMMPPAAPMSPVSTPAMSGPLSGNPTPMSLDLGPLGDKVYVTGAVTGMVFAQSEATKFSGLNDNPTGLDLTNGQVFIQKVDGVFQYFVQVGAYSLPALGGPIVKSSLTSSALFGVVPQAFLKLQLADNFSIMGGKLPTLVGDEYTFTFENMDIFRGLLWNQEPAVSRGVQVNYTAGPVAFSASVNDGYYSNRYNWISGSAAWTIDPSNTLSFVGAGNMGRTDYALSATPLLQNNGSIYNIIYTHTDGPWVISPYFQYSTVSADAKTGIVHDASTTGGAVLISYAVDDNWKLAGRVEYISSTGKGATLATSTNLLYGPGSDAWSFTLTPTYQYKTMFARAEISYVSIGSSVAGLALGPHGTSTSQTRGAFEIGVLF